MKPDFKRQLTVTIGSNTLTLSDLHSIRLNNKEIKQLPFQTTDLIVRQATSQFVLIESTEMHIAYDGNAVYLTFGAMYRERIRGLCGSFDYDENNDLRLPNGKLTCDTDVFSGGYLINDTKAANEVATKFDRSAAVRISNTASNRGVHIRVSWLF